MSSSARYQTFSVSHEVFGSTVVVDLCPGGRDIDVTDENKAEWVEALVDWATTRRVEQPLCALVAGFHEVGRRGWLQGGGEAVRACITRRVPAASGERALLEARVLSVLFCLRPPSPSLPPSLAHKATFVY